MAPSKFGRNYILNIQTINDTTLTIQLPFTVQFDITRNVLTSANVAQFRIYNLNANNRAQIRKNINDFGDNRVVQILAGYGNNLSLMFEGNITQAWSAREGVDFITQIECFDGGFAFSNSMSNTTFPAQTEMTTVAETLIGDLSSSGVKPGIIGSFPGQLSRGNAYSGNTCQLLQQITGGRFYIDNGKAYALSDNECIAGPVTTINAASGLLNTPIREQTIITFDMLFEPKMIVGQQITLDSVTADSNINGEYKVISLKHRGMISDAVCGDAITTVGLLQPLGTQKLTVVQ
jgi:hypothetical protein